MCKDLFLLLLLDSSKKEKNKTGRSSSFNRATRIDGVHYTQHRRERERKRRKRPLQGEEEMTNVTGRESNDSFLSLSLSNLLVYIPLRHFGSTSSRRLDVLNWSTKTPISSSSFSLFCFFFLPALPAIRTGQLRGQQQQQQQRKRRMDKNLL